MRRSPAQPTTSCSSGSGSSATAWSSPRPRRVTRQTPRVVGQRILAWAERRRRTTKGKIFLGALLIFAGIVVPQDPRFWLTLSVYVAGLWLVYLGVFELMAFVRQRAPAAPRAQRRERAAPVGRSPASWSIALLAAGDRWLPVPDAASRQPGRRRRPAPLQRRHGPVQRAAERRRLPGQPQLDVVVALPRVALRRADQHHQGPARRRHPRLPHRHPLRRAELGAGARAGRPPHRHRPGRRAGPTAGQGQRSGHRGQGTGAGGKGDPCGPRQAEHLPLPQHLRDRGRPVLLGAR